MPDGLDLLEEKQKKQQPQAQKPVQEPKEPEQIATVDACKPDVWDENGRLISHDHLNPV